MKVFIFITLCLFELGYAFHVRGNGGYGVICYDSLTDKDTLYVLEEYELKRRYGDKFILYSKEQSVAAKLKDYIYRAKINSLSDKEVVSLELFANFLIDRIEPVYSVPSILDFGVLPKIDSNCSLVPLGFQTQGGIAQRKLLVNKFLWGLLNENQKAILLLHEVIYGFWLVRNEPSFGIKNVERNPEVLRRFVQRLLLEKPM